MGSVFRPLDMMGPLNMPWDLGSDIGKTIKHPRYAILIITTKKTYLNFIRPAARSAKATSCGSPSDNDEDVSSPDVSWLAFDFFLE